MRIERREIWSAATVRSMCIHHGLYTCGDNEEYAAMLLAVEATEPTDEQIYLIASDINYHSQGQTISNIMFMLANEAVTTCYSVYNEEGEEIE